MFPGYTPKNPQQAPTAALEEAKATQATFYRGSTKDINVLQSRFSQQSVNIANDPSDIEQRLQAVVVMKRLRIEEFFKDFDKLRKGKVTVPQFKGVLSMMNYYMTEEEFEALSNKYATSDNMFNYAQFCHNINSAFT